MTVPPVTSRHPTAWTFLTRLTAILGAMVVLAMLITLIQFAASNHELGVQVKAQGARITTQNAQIKAQNAQIKDLAKSSKQLLAQFQDCIQPSGECAKRGQQQTAIVIAELEHVVIAANVCPGLPTIPVQPPRVRLQAVSACVAKLLSQEHPNGP